MTQQNDQRQQHLQSLIVLTGRCDQNRILFWVTLSLGLVALILFATMTHTRWMGLAVFGAVMIMLGIPGLIGWRRAEGEIATVKASMAELERSESRYQGYPAQTVQPNPQNTEVSFCRNCGKELVGAKMFCQSCGAKSQG